MIEPTQLLTAFASTTMGSSPPRVLWLRESQTSEPAAGTGSVVRTRPRGDMFYEQGLRDAPRHGRPRSVLSDVRELWRCLRG